MVALSNGAFKVEMKCPICDAEIDDSIMASRIHKQWHEEDKK